MPAPESPRPDQPASDSAPSARAPTGQRSSSPDLSAIPAFLRGAGRSIAAGPERDEAAGAIPLPRPAPALPRPVTPPPPSAPRATRQALDPATLPMPSLSRRRLITAGGVLLAGWLTVTFVRQVGEATTAANRADELRAANAAMREDVTRLEADLDRVQDMRLIRLEGRSFGLGGRGEIPFALAAGAPPLAADAPGSASNRLGAEQHSVSPLDAWLEILFGGGS
jgi:hypothetical protein